MSLPDPLSVPPISGQTRMALAMAGIGIGLMTAAGALLWWREGDKLFTDGLVSALMRCF